MSPAMPRAARCARIAMLAEALAEVERMERVTGALLPEAHRGLALASYYERAALVAEDRAALANEPPCGGRDGPHTPTQGSKER